MPGVGNVNSLLGAIGRPYHGYHNPMARKSAALLHGIATSHGFIDGNKRTAWLMTFLLVRRSGYDLEIRPDDRIDDIVVQVVEGTMTEDQLVQWFKLRLRRG
ncbi:MAG: type II toxin-antitoxin system death-on-curing family toxin [Paracoccaceae bacterium]